MDEWEYRYEMVDDLPPTPGARPEAVTQRLNELGRSGWELVAIVLSADGFDAIFKRRRQTGS